MNILTYSIQAFAWSVAGAFIGYMIGATVAREGMDVTQKKRWRPRFDIVITVVVLTLGVLTAVQGYVLGQRTADLSRCQLAYSSGFADALDARSQSSRAAQDALDQWMTSINNTIQAPSPQAADKIRAAFRDYLDARAKAKQTQEDNPYPPAPRDLCPDSVR